MEPIVAEKRHLHSYTVGLSDEQILRKDELMSSVAAAYPDVSMWFRELLVDYYVRCPDDLDAILKAPDPGSKFSPTSLQALAQE